MFGHFAHAFPCARGGRARSPTAPAPPWHTHRAQRYTGRCRASPAAEGPRELHTRRGKGVRTRRAEACYASAGRGMLHLGVPGHVMPRRAEACYAPAWHAGACYASAWEVNHFSSLRFLFVLMFPQNSVFSLQSHFRWSRNYFLKLRRYLAQPHVPHVIKATGHAVVLSSDFSFVRY